MFSPSTMFLKKFFANENMKKPASKVDKPAQIQPKSQFLFHKNLSPRDFSIMTLRLGGKWAIAQAVFNRSQRDQIKKDLGPDLNFIVLNLTRECQLKRVCIRTIEEFQ